MERKGYMAGRSSTLVSQAATRFALCTLHSTHLHFALLCTVFHCLRNLRPSAASSLLHVDKVVFDDAAKKWYGLRNTFPRTPHQKFTFTLFTLPYFALFILHCSNSHFAQLGIVLKCFTAQATVLQGTCSALSPAS